MIGRDITDLFDLLNNRSFPAGGAPLRIVMIED